MTVKETISSKLSVALEPASLEVIDESHLHQGHVGARPEGETHFRVIIVSEKFAGLTRIDRQRLINNLLSEELEGPVHALALKTQTPQEHARLSTRSD